MLQSKFTASPLSQFYQQLVQAEVNLNKLIPTYSGYNNHNQLKIQSVYCIVYGRLTLKVLATAETHNEASQIATEIFNKDKVFAVPGEIRFSDESISHSNILGMNLVNFEFFVEANMSHPLIKSTFTGEH